MIRWPFRLRVTKTVAPSRDPVATAASALSRHRTEAQRALVIATALKMRAELGLGDDVKVRG